MASLRVALCRTLNQRSISTQLCQRTKNSSNSLCAASQSRLFHASSSCQKKSEDEIQSELASKYVRKVTFQSKEGRDKLGKKYPELKEEIDFRYSVLEARAHPKNQNAPFAELSKSPYHNNERIPFVNAPPPLPVAERPRTEAQQNGLFYGGVLACIAAYAWGEYVDITAPTFGDLDWDAIRAERNAAKDEDDEDEDEDEEEEEEEAEDDDE